MTEFGLQFAGGASVQELLADDAFGPSRHVNHSAANIGPVIDDQTPKASIQPTRFETGTGLHRHAD